MSRTIRRTLLTLAGSALTALPVFAQGLPPVYATPPASTRPPADPSGYDLFQTIADYAEARAAEARKRNDPTATAGWDRIRTTYRVTDERRKADLQTRSQAQAVCDLTSAFAKVGPDDADGAGLGVATWNVIFLSDLFLENLPAKPGTGWVVGREKLETLHREICKELLLNGTARRDVPTVRPLPPATPRSPTDIPFADPTPRPVAPPPAWTQSPTHIPVETAVPLHATLQDAIDRTEAMARWYAEEQKTWAKRDTERQAKWDANLAAIEAGKPLPHPEVQMFPTSMAPTMQLIEDSRLFLDAVQNPKRYTAAELDRIHARMRGHEKVNQTLNADLAWRKLMTKIETDIQLRQANRLELYHGSGLNLTPMPTPSGMPTVR